MLNGKRTCLWRQLKKPFVQRLILLLLSALVAINIGWTLWHGGHTEESEGAFVRMGETWHR
jgi:hypothetical protein